MVYRNAVGIHRILAITMLVSGSATIAGCETATPVGQAAPTARLYMSADRPDTATVDPNQLQAVSMDLEYNQAILREQLSLARVFADRKDMDRARSLYAKALQIAPTSFEANYEYGVALRRMGQYEQATKYLLTALTIRPDDPQAVREMGLAFMQAGMPRDAQPWVKRAAEQNPQDFQVLLTLANAYAGMGEYEQTLASLLDASAFGTLDDAALLTEADAQIHLADYAGALETLAHIIKVGKPDARVWERQGYARFKLKQYDQAIASFNKALELNPKDTASLNGLGVTLMSQFIVNGRNDFVAHDRAIEVWRRSLLIDPYQDHIKEILSRYQTPR